MGDIDLKAEEGVYQVKTKEKDIGTMTRAVKLKEKTNGKATVYSLSVNWTFRRFEINYL